MTRSDELRTSEPFEVVAHLRSGFQLARSLRQPKGIGHFMIDQNGPHDVDQPWGHWKAPAGVVADESNS